MHYTKSLISPFQVFFVSINKVFPMALGYQSIKFRHFPDNPYFPKIVSLMFFSNSWSKPYIHIYMVISNNCTSFHLRWKENLIKNEKVSKYYGNDWLRTFLLLFCLSYQLNLLKTAMFRLGFTLMNFKVF